MRNFNLGDKVISKKFGIGTVKNVMLQPDISGYPVIVYFEGIDLHISYTVDGKRFIDDDHLSQDNIKHLYDRDDGQEMLSIPDLIICIAMAIVNVMALQWQTYLISLKNLRGKIKTFMLANRSS